MDQRPVIGVTVSRESRYQRCVYLGVAEFSRIPPHRFNLRMLPLDPLRSLRPLPDGLILHVTTPKMAREARQLPIPVVNASGRIENSGLPSVVGDDIAVGSCAAEHLLDKGFRHFGFYGRRNIPYQTRRWEGFVRTVESRGFRCEPFLRDPDSEGRPAGSELRRLVRWLLNLPRPVGILAASDWAALDLYDACVIAGLRIRDDVALVGVDNDEFLCECCDPPLSSVDNQPQRIGFEAAALLLRMLQGRSRPSQPIYIPPLRVVQRQSSDVFAGRDPHVAAVLQYIHNHSDRTLRAKDLLAVVPISRRVLERRFRQSLGRSLLEEIHLQRVERIKLLLTTTQLTIEEIAAACGFAQSSHMSVLFRKTTGTSPGDYRRRFQSRRWIH